MIRPHDKAGAAKGHAGRAKWKSGGDSTMAALDRGGPNPRAPVIPGSFPWCREFTRDLNLASLLSGGKRLMSRESQAIAPSSGASNA